MIENNDVRIDENKQRCNSLSCTMHNMEFNFFANHLLIPALRKRAKAGVDNHRSKASSRHRTLYLRELGLGWSFTTVQTMSMFANLSGVLWTVPTTIGKLYELRILRANLRNILYSQCMIFTTTSTKGVSPARDSSARDSFSAKSYLGMNNNCTCLATP